MLILFQQNDFKFVKKNVQFNLFEDDTKKQFALDDRN